MFAAEMSNWTTEGVVPEDSGGGEKTEEPTPRKRQKAREEGQVASSTELSTAALLLAGFAVLIASAPGLYGSFTGIIRHSFTDALNQEINIHSFSRLFGQQMGSAGLWWLVIAGSLFLISIGVLVAQVGFQIAPKALMPKASKISPLAGFKRIYGLRGIMKFVFNFLKLILITVIAWVFLEAIIPEMNSYTLDLRQRLAHDVWVFMELAFVLAAVIAIIAIFDFMYQRFQHTRDLMMTKQEVKEEFKQSDGDPLVKSKIRQIQRQMAQQRMMQEVPKADVVITNPTHVAVALKYDQDTMFAPTVIAKGYDEVAQRIKKIAEEHNIPMVENVPLARALAKNMQIGQEITDEFYQGVAEVLSYIYRLNGTLDEKVNQIQTSQ